MLVIDKTELEQRIEEIRTQLWDIMVAEGVGYTETEYDELNGELKDLKVLLVLAEGHPSFADIVHNRELMTC